MGKINDELKARFGQDFNVFLWYWCIDLLMLLVLAMLYAINLSPWVRQILQMQYSPEIVDAVHSDFFYDSVDFADLDRSSKVESETKIERNSVCEMG